jgi:hypothetical protein
MTTLPYMQVHQDYAHHIDADPIEVVGMWAIFAWPVGVPEGWDRVSTPLLTEARLVALRAACEGQTFPEANPQPIPEPEPEEEPI